ncbi:MAG: ABC transporter substrate-binding protein [Scytonematopsis contorta HA4267-MV1]|jgi:serine/threonine-protein kinase|nr:ABC transporter substrate-binding protein [Scytonematopsis contorta HA4267-MV1]
MTNSNCYIDVYCTRPGCEDPANIIPADSLTPGSVKQRFCSCCGMPLILRARFLPLRLLLPDEEQGGFGRTFLGQDIDFPGKLRVIKQLHPRIPPGRSQLSQSQLQRIEKLFHREGNILAELSNPQIPRAWAFTVVEAPPNQQEQFAIETSNRQKFFYLVQDYIEGQNLAQELRQRGKFSENDVVKVLKEILNILQYIHNYNGNRGVIHRDIKPSNIMRCSADGKIYLIDFGAVKQVVVTGVSVGQSSILGTPDFAPPEQFIGEQVYPSSDLYSLAATCVCLLTGKNPGKIVLNSSWREYASLKDNRLAGILDKMLQPKPEERFQSAQEVIEALFYTKKSHASPIPSSKRKTIPPTEQSAKTTPPITTTIREKPVLPSLIFKSSILRKYWYLLASFAFLLLVIIFVVKPSKPELAASCIYHEHFSCGEKRLIASESWVKSRTESRIKGTDEFFGQGINEFTSGKYNSAIRYFETYLKSYPNDPEARIYLNNAKAVESKKFVKVAVCVPIFGSINARSPKDGVAEQILRGVALAQEETNEDAGIDGKKLFIQICDDGNDAGQAEAVAQEIVNDKSILGVIGHYSSTTTLAAGKIYGDNKKVAISPTSTAVRNRDYFPLSEYVFRTSPNNSISAERLVAYIRSKKISKVAIVYENNQHYTQSLRNEFLKQLANKEKLVGECDVSQDKTQLSNCIQDSQSKGAQAVLLAINVNLAHDKATAIFSNRGNVIILAGSSIYIQDALDAKIAEKKLIVATYWHRSESNSISTFEKMSGKLWGTRYINFLAAMGYDATQAMVKGLDRTNGTYDNLFNELNNRNFFTAQGAGTDVEFQKGDRKVDSSNKNQLMFLVTPRYNPDTKEYDFVPVE